MLRPKGLGTLHAVASETVRQPTWERSAPGRVVVVAHPVIEDCLAYLRDRTTSLADFRRA